MTAVAMLLPPRGIDLDTRGEADAGATPEGTDDTLSERVYGRPAANPMGYGANWTAV